MILPQRPFRDIDEIPRSRAIPRFQYPYHKLANQSEPRHLQPPNGEPLKSFEKEGKYPDEGLGRLTDPGNYVNAFIEPKQAEIATEPTQLSADATPLDRALWPTTHEQVMKEIAKGRLRIPLNKTGQIVRTTVRGSGDIHGETNPPTSIKGAALAVRRSINDVFVKYDMDTGQRVYRK